MPISTYAELQAAAANWLVRGDLTARIPEFVSLAEARLNRVLRTRLSEVETPLTGVIGARTVPLPAGFAEALQLWLIDGDGRRPLRFVTADLMGASSLRGEPALWTVDGANFAFERPCDRAYDFVLRWRRAFALSDAASTNALLTEHPDVYLFATLCEAAPFLRDAELSGAYESRLGRALEEAARAAARTRAPRTLGVDPSLSAGAGA
jgi:hypothetical protein